MVKSTVRAGANAVAMVVILAFVILGSCAAQNTGFHGAPGSAKSMKNPFAGMHGDSVRAAYHRRCANCHGDKGEGMGNVPALAMARRSPPVTENSSGTSPRGMLETACRPGISSRPRRRWQIVSYLRVLGRFRARIAAG